MMTSSQMRGKLTAEQFCIWAGYDDMNLPAQESVDKQIPLRYILYLIDKQVVEISVYLVKDL